MKINVEVTGLQELRAKLVDGFSERRLRAAVATGLTRTAGAIAGVWKAEINQEIDRPTPLTRGAVVVLRADAESLTATVLVKDQLPAGAITPAEYLGVQETGGRRRLRKFEQALQAQGSMPSGMYVVPGKGAKLDGFGNVSRSQIVQVLAQLGAKYSPGYARVISSSAKKRAAKAVRLGRSYVAILQTQGKLVAGVYERKDRDLVPVFIYKRLVTYRKRLDLIGEGTRTASAELGRQVELAIAEQTARLTAK